jgi:hypothetical protein
VAGQVATDERRVSRSSSVYSRPHRLSSSRSSTLDSMDYLAVQLTAKVLHLVRRSFCGSRQFPAAGPKHDSSFEPFAVPAGADNTTCGVDPESPWKPYGTPEGSRSASSRQSCRRRSCRSSFSLLRSRATLAGARPSPVRRLGPAEVAAYYGARFPHLRQLGSGQWRTTCPLHDGKRPNFSVDPSMISEWVNACEARPVIVVDSIIAFFTGDENSSSDVRPFMQQLGD